MIANGELISGTATEGGVWVVFGTRLFTISYCILGSAAGRSRPVRAAVKPNARSRTEVPIAKMEMAVRLSRIRSPALADSAESTLFVNLRLLSVGLLRAGPRRIGRGDNGALRFTSV
jgi:hypothetical protein